MTDVIIGYDKLRPLHHSFIRDPFIHHAVRMVKQCSLQLRSSIVLNISLLCYGFFRLINTASQGGFLLLVSVGWLTNVVNNGTYYVGYCAPLPFTTAYPVFVLNVILTQVIA